MGKIVALKARMRTAPPANIRESLDGAGQEPSAERRIGNEPDAESRGLSSAWRETQIDGKGAPKRPFMMRKMRRPRYFRGTTGSRLNL